MGGSSSFSQNSKNKDKGDDNENSMNSNGKDMMLHSSNEFHAPKLMFFLTMFNQILLLPFLEIMGLIGFNGFLFDKNESIFMIIRIIAIIFFLGYLLFGIFCNFFME